MSSDLGNLYIYIRVSSKGQTDGGSLETQESIGKKVAKQLSLKPVVLSEGGKSSTRGYRDVLEDDIKLGIEKRKIKHLWVLDRSRLFRDSADSQYFRKDYLERYGCKFYEGEYGNEVRFDSVDETLAYDLISRIQQAENEKRSAKSKEGKRYLLRRGVENKHYGGTVIFGYKSINGFYEVDKEEAQWVKWMFDATLKGLTVAQVKSELDKNAVKPRRAKTWQHESILKILHNRHYIGERTFVDKELKRKGFKHEFTYKVTDIVSRTKFLKVQKILSDRQKQKDNNKKHFSLFSDFMVCECGKSIGSIVKQGTRKNGKTYDTRQYFCLSRQQLWKQQIKSQCENVKSMQMQKTDEFLINEIKQVAENSHILKDKFKTEVLQTKFDEDKDIKEKQKVLERKCQTIIRNQGRTMENIISIETDIVQGRTDEKIARGIINNLHDEIEDYKEELQKTETDLDTLLSRKEWLDWISHYSESLKIESQKEEDKKRWVEGLVKKIVVHSEYGLNREEKEVQVGHSFDIHFKMKIVNDQLVYKDESNKKLGYEIKDGKSVLKLDEVNFNYLRGSKKKAGL